MLVSSVRSTLRQIGTCDASCFGQSSSRNGSDAPLSCGQDRPGRDRLRLDATTTGDAGVFQINSNDRRPAPVPISVTGSGSASAACESPAGHKRRPQPCSSLRDPSASHIALRPARPSYAAFSSQRPLLSGSRNGGSNTPLDSIARCSPSPPAVPHHRNDLSSSKLRVSAARPRGRRTQTTVPVSLPTSSGDPVEHDLHDVPPSSVRRPSPDGAGPEGPLPGHRPACS